MTGPLIVVHYLLLSSSFSFSLAYLAVPLLQVLLLFQPDRRSYFSFYTREPSCRHFPAVFLVFTCRLPFLSVYFGNFFFLFRTYPTISTDLDLVYRRLFKKLPSFGKKDYSILRFVNKPWLLFITIQYFLWVLELPIKEDNLTIDRLAIKVNLRQC